MQNVSEKLFRLGTTCSLLLLLLASIPGCKSAKKKEAEPYRILADSFIVWNQTNLAPCFTSTNKTIRAAAWARVAEHEPLLNDPGSKEEPYLRSLQHDDAFLPALCGLTLCNNSNDNLIWLNRFAELDQENALPELLLAQFEHERGNHPATLHHLLNAARKPFLAYRTTYAFIQNRGIDFRPGAQQMMEIELFKTMAPFRAWVDQLDQTTAAVFPPNTDPRLPTALAILLYDHLAAAQPITFTMLYSSLDRNQRLLAKLENDMEPALQKAISSQLSTRKVLLPYLHANQESGPVILESLPVSNKFSHGSDFRKQLLKFLEQ